TPYARQGICKQTIPLPRPTTPCGSPLQSYPTSSAMIPSPTLYNLSFPPCQPASGDTIPARRWDSAPGVPTPSPASPAGSFVLHSRQYPCASAVAHPAEPAASPARQGPDTAAADTQG